MLNPNVTWFTHHFFKALPVFVGCFTIYLGYRLFILGVSGDASLSLDSKTFSGRLLNASPGLFFALGGICIVIISVWKGGFISIRRTKAGLHALANCAPDEQTQVQEQSQDASGESEQKPKGIA